MRTTYDTVWMRTREVADLLGVTPAEVAGFIDDGTLAGYRFGTVIRCRRSDVLTFIATRGIASGS
jgi:excisionase family DNA binding protein